MTKYIWQHKNWPTFRWEQNKIEDYLLAAKKAQGFILGQAQFFDLKEIGEIITEEAFNTSTIEGESIDKRAIRSSVASRLGLPTAGLPNTQRNAEGLVEVLMDATTNFESKLTGERLQGWQAALFPTGFSGIRKINVGKWRETLTPMQVISGPMSREKIHYEAPPSSKINEEMKGLLRWWNNEASQYDGIIRAGIAHFWFVTIHPFEDGNGRIARVITDMSLAQDEKTKKRLYSLSSQIMRDKKNYYNILEKTQKGSGDITEWLIWFLKMFTNAIENSKTVIEKSLFIGKFYKSISEISLNERQRKVIKKILESYPDEFAGGLTNKKYVSITKISSETAKRDIKDLVEKSILLQNDAKGRSTSYRLNRNI